MGLTTTTLLNGIGGSDTLIGLTSVAGVGAPNNATGAGATFLFVGNEMMKVCVGPRDTHWIPNVQRGVNGTIAAAHLTGESVLVGGPADFPILSPTAFTVSKYVAVFGSTTSLSVTAATHKLGASIFHVTIYDASSGTRNRVEPGSLQIDGLGNVTVTFAVAQAGQIVIE
jgi:hypothetical protein